MVEDTKPNIVDWGEDEFPDTQITYDKQKGLKYVTDYDLNNDEERIKIVKTFRVETKRVLKCVAERKKWKKFGEDKNEPDGPQSKTTQLSEEAALRFVSKDGGFESAVAKSKKDIMPTLRCQLCSGPHFTTTCKLKGLIAPFNEMKMNQPEMFGQNVPGGDTRPARPGVYTAPALREGAKPMERPLGRRGNNYGIRILNLSTDASEQDLVKMCSQFGPVVRARIHTDRSTGRPKGSAMVFYENQADADCAQKRLDRYGFDNLLMKVEILQPQPPK